MAWLLQAVKSWGKCVASPGRNSVSSQEFSPVVMEDRRCPIMGLLYDTVPPSSPYQVMQLSKQAAQRCKEGSFLNKTAASLLLQKPQVLCAKIAMAELHKTGINEKP